MKKEGTFSGGDVLFVVCFSDVGSRKTEAAFQETFAEQVVCSSWVKLYGCVLPKIIKKTFFFCGSRCTGGRFLISSQT